MDLLHAPFKDSTLFGGDLAKLQKANTEGANALTRLTVLLTAASSTPPALCGPRQELQLLQEFLKEERGRAGDTIDLLLLLPVLDLLKIARC